MPTKTKRAQKTSQAAAPPPPAPAKPAPGVSLLAWIERHAVALAIGLALLASIRIIATYTVFNHTFDEPVHIACGMEWLDKGVYQWEYQHPPLSRIAVALGPYLSGIRSQGVPRLDGYSRSYEGDAILYYGHHYDRTLALARLGVLPFFWVACWVVFAWGRRYFGAAIAALALLLFTFEPTVLAHAGMATTDMALTAFLGAAFYRGMVWLEQPTRANTLWFGLTAGLMVLSKFTCLLFFPAAAGAALAWWYLSRRPGMARVIALVKERAPSFAGAVVLACVVVWAGYRFSFGDAGFWHLKLPAPELYAGIREVARHNAEGHTSYLLGERSMTGFWCFYLVSLAVKTPVGYLALMGFGAVLALRKKDGVAGLWIPLAFAGAITVAASCGRINIGLRHILPVYIGFSLMAAAAIVKLVEMGAARRWMPAVPALLTGWLCVSSLMAHPDYIPYFNEFAGSQPEKILVDSDLDWGQDVKRLAARLKKEHAASVVFFNQMIADFEGQHGFPPIPKVSDALYPARGWNAVSLTFLKERRMGLFEEHLDVQPWPERIPPMDRVGKGILLWYFR
jgi:Dolichyl-phosphate-mannose-protein mannosyltransferase